MARPEPRIVSEVCSLCGLDWRRHGKAPTADKCVELLLEEVRSLNARLAHRPIAQPWPYIPTAPVVPYAPWRPYGPIWATTTSGTSVTPTASTTQVFALTSGNPSSRA